jgi:type I restriction enzyme, S subunit
MASKSADIGTGRTGGREATTGVIPGRIALSVGCPDLTPPKGWRWTPLGSVAQLESGHTPSRKHPEYWDGGIPWIGIKDATENHGRTLSDTHQHISELGLANSSARLLPANTVCLSRTASVGYVVVISRPMATSQDFVNWVCGPNLEPHYLKYVLLAENEALWRFASGTTHQTIYYPEAKAFHVCLPSLAEQKRIAGILCALDDKIELNRKMNETLEQMASALFKSWFIDFDPAHAKAVGRQPAGMDKATAELFPDSFVDSELGKIPKGWEISTLGEDVTITRGCSYKSEDLASSSTAMVTLKSFKRGGGYRHDGLKSYTGAYKPAQVVRTGELVVSYTDVTQAAELIGRPAIVSTTPDFKQLVISQDVSVVRPKNSTPISYLYRLMMEESFRAHTYAHSTGTTVLHLSSTALPSFKFIKPKTELLAAFDKTAANLMKLTDENHQQSRLLSATRDALLPKLLSGVLVPQNA